MLHRAERAAPGLLFLSPSAGPGYRGVMIVDDSGELVWFRKTYPETAMDFRPAVYRGQPVLTWWESLPGHGLGNGVHVVMDASYRELARFPAGHGRPSDLHELQITARNTALVTSFETRRTDLSHVGASSRGLVTGGVAQELEIPSARVLFEWRSRDHVPVTDAYNPIGYPWDYFHINAIDVDTDGDLLISGRNTWCVYKVDRRTGRVRWRLGGKHSDFALGRGARFAYQHDARRRPDGTISIFDNGGAERTQVESQSRALVLRLDERRKRATVVHDFRHRPPVFGRQMGNVQLLPNGNTFVGWGTDPHFTEFGPLGDVRFDATLPPGGENYRTFRFPWRGRPLDRPALARAGSLLYASWNGATEVATWELRSGTSESALDRSQTVQRTGFETALEIPAGARYAAAVARDRTGAPLGSSPVVATA